MTAHHLLAALLCAALLPATALAQATGGFRLFEVRVIDSEGEPLLDATVNVSAGELEFPLTVDKEGIAVLNLPTDARFLTLLASCPGHIPLEVRWQAQIPNEFTFTMSKGQPIGGIVHDERGKPIEGVQVEGLLVSSKAADDGEVRPLVGGEIGLTDKQGQWRADIATEEPLELRLKLTHEKYFSDVSYGKRRVSNDDLRNLTHVEVMDDLLPPQGTIRDSAGKPVADVAVYLIKDNKKLTVKNGRVAEDIAAANRSNEEGKFEFIDPETDFAVLFLGDDGWAFSLAKPFSKNKPVDIALIAWGRVEGVLAHDGKPAPQERLQVLVLDNGLRADAHIDWNNRAETNDKGEFVFERVSNGHAMLGGLVEYCGEIEHERQVVSNETQISVVPGQTTKVDMQRRGLQVVGMVVPLRYDESEAAIACGIIAMEKQDETVDMVRNIFFEWGKAASVGLEFDPVRNAALVKSPPKPSYVAKLENDGSFRAENVPPGTYRANIIVWCEETDEEQAGWRSGHVWEAFEIAPDPDAKDKSVDLKLMEIEVYESAEE